MPVNVTVNETEVISLVCQARGSSAPTFTWYHDGTVETNPATDTSMGTPPDFITVESTLMISDAMPSDAGIYTCDASNTVYGTVRSDVEQYIVTVNCKHCILCDTYVCPCSDLMC